MSAAAWRLGGASVWRCGLASRADTALARALRPGRPSSMPVNASRSPVSAIVVIDAPVTMSTAIVRTRAARCHEVRFQRATQHRPSSHAPRSAGGTIASEKRVRRMSRRNPAFTKTATTNQRRDKREFARPSFVAVTRADCQRRGGDNGQAPEKPEQPRVGVRGAVQGRRDAQRGQGGQQFPPCGPSDASQTRGADHVRVIAQRLEVPGRGIDHAIENALVAFANELQPISPLERVSKRLACFGRPLDLHQRPIRRRESNERLARHERQPRP